MDLFNPTLVAESRSAGYLPESRLAGSIHTLKYTHRAAMATLTTRVFNNGNSQAVRIPAEFRLDTDRVLISRNEQGDLILHPVRAERGTALLEALRAVNEADGAFVSALEAERAAALPLQDREPL